MLDDLRDKSYEQRQKSILEIARRIERCNSGLKEMNRVIDDLTKDDVYWSITMDKSGWSTKIQLPEFIAKELKQEVIDRCRKFRREIIEERNKLLKFNVDDKTNGEVWEEERNSK